jgi:hypothetical protein
LDITHHREHPSETQPLTVKVFLLTTAAFVQPRPIRPEVPQDTGYDSADVLAHCCGEGLHVKGCWVVDVVLGKG